MLGAQSTTKEYIRVENKFNLSPSYSIHKSLNQKWPIMETLIKEYIVERTNKAEIRPEDESEKAENCRDNL